MAGPTTTALLERIENLTSSLQDGLARLNGVEQMHDLRLKALETFAAAAAEARKESEAKSAEQAVQITRLEEQLSAALKLLDEKDKRYDERGRMLEKLSDRGWGIGQAIVVAVLSMLGGAVITLLVQLAIKK